MLRCRPWHLGPNGLRSPRVLNRHRCPTTGSFPNLMQAKPPSYLSESPSPPFPTPRPTATTVGWLTTYRTTTIATSSR